MAGNGALCAMMGGRTTRELWHRQRQRRVCPPAPIAFVCAPRAWESASAKALPSTASTASTATAVLPSPSPQTMSAPLPAAPSLDATAPPPEAFSDTENGSPSPQPAAFPLPPMPRLGSLGVHEPYVRSFVQQTPDWPRPGITFLDISPLLADMRALKHCVDSLAERYGGGHLTHVAGIDARGFTLGCALAYKLGCGFIMVRKAGKLPPGDGESSSLLSEQYEMEYGTVQLQVPADLFESSSVAPRVLLVDDLLATGGSARAACNLLRTAGATIVEVAVLIELCSSLLCGRRRLKEEGYIDLHSLICFSDDGSPCV